MHSQMYFEPESSQWNIVSLRDPSVNLTLQDNNADVPMGRHTWHVENYDDHNGCSNLGVQGSSNIVNLLFSSCKNGQYSCDSGECLDDIR